MSKEGIYIAKKEFTKDKNSDEWIKIPSQKKKNKKKTYSYEENLKRKIERKKKNYQYKITRNKKELEKFVSDNSLFIKNRLNEGYTINDDVLKNEINYNLDTLENKYNLACNCDNLREFLQYREEVKNAINFINEKINKKNFTQLILDDKIGNVNPEMVNKIKNKLKPVQPKPKVWKTIEPGISFLDVLKSNQ